MAERFNILVVDDEEKILKIVRSYLEDNGYAAFAAKNGQEALEMLQRHTISLVLLDLMLPDIPGEALCRKIRANSDMPIIMMTAKVDEQSVINGLEIGADDYVTKPFSPRQLMARVAAALRRAKMDKTQKMLEWGSLRVDTQSRTVYEADRLVSLTPNEYNILVLLMSRPQKTFTRDEIIASVKTDEFMGYDRAIDSHIKNLRQKLEDDPKSQKYITTVYGIGYRLGGGGGS